jgi:hypothetical protein
VSRDPVCAVSAGVLAALAVCAAPADGQPFEVPPASATAGYTYYNRPGADPAEHDRDLRACALIAGQIRTTLEVMSAQTLSPPSSSTYGERNYAAAALENCMIVRGWRVVAVSDDEGKALAALPAADLAARLAPWIGAADPHGQVARVWTNQAIRAQFRFGDIAGPKKRGQLSLMAAAPDLKKLPAAPEGMPPSPWISPRWPLRALKAADLPSLRPDAAVLLVMIRKPGFHGGIGVVFNRVGPDAETFPSSLDHAPDRIWLGEGILFASAHGDMYAFAVPAGRWRLYALGDLPLLNLCLGSPSFEVKAGEVVYAGAFDLSGDDLDPDLDLGPARDWMAGEDKPVRAATYVNGSLGPCGDNGVDALEFRRAPFESGYAWGSRAQDGGR